MNTVMYSLQMKRRPTISLGISFNSNSFMQITCAMDDPQHRDCVQSIQTSLAYTKVKFLPMKERLNKMQLIKRMQFFHSKQRKVITKWSRIFLRDGLRYYIYMDHSVTTEKRKPFFTRMFLITSDQLPAKTTRIIIIFW